MHKDPAKFEVGDPVSKVKGYEFPGIVACVFYTMSNERRYVVEMEKYHVLHIFSEEQLRYRNNA